MQALEFEADIENGVLHIPDNIREVGKVHAKVILLINDNHKKKYQPYKKRLMKESKVVLEPIQWQNSKRLR